MQEWGILKKSQERTKTPRNIQVKGIFRRSLGSKIKPKFLNSPKKSLRKVFESVNETHEEDKNESEDETFQLSGPYRQPSFKRDKDNVKGILALTKENLRKLDLKNQVSPTTQPSLA